MNCGRLACTDTSYLGVNFDKALRALLNFVVSLLLCLETGCCCFLDVQRLSSEGTYTSSLLKTVSSPVNPTGRTFNYTFQARNLALPGTNSNSATLYNVIVTDNFPVGVAPTKKHWFKVKRNSTCSFSGADSRIMKCNLGKMVAEETVEFTVEVKADGKNFAGQTALTDKLNNTATLTCNGNRTATTPDAGCTKKSTANTMVRRVLQIMNCIGSTM
jgi:hypothetical protein